MYEFSLIYSQRVEEQVMTGRMTVIMNIYGDVCGIHKPGGCPIDPSLLKK